MFESRRGSRRAALAAAVLVLATAALVAVASGCGSSGSSSPSGHPSPGGIPTYTPTPTVTPQVVPSVSARSIIDAAKADGLDGFAAAVAAAGLDAALKQNIPYTVLAPNAEAFKSLGLEGFIKNVSKAKTVMDYHVIPAEDLKVDEIKDGQEVPTYLGYNVRFTVKDGALMVNDANVVKVIEGPTWSIFVIDKVLAPPDFATPAASVPATP